MTESVTLRMAFMAASKIWWIEGFQHRRFVIEAAYLTEALRKLADEIEKGDKQ
jgi:hypothetical protein